MSDGQSLPEYATSPGSIRIGIVGHRTNHPLHAGIAAEIAAAFSLVEKASEIGARFTLVSGLAEGADQMAILAKPAAWRLEGILPFSVEDYEADFAEAADGSRRDMRSAFRDMIGACHAITAIASERGDPQAYHRSGLLMLRTLDVLVAVWNGEPARGPGGTADIVRAAVEAEIPVLWIKSQRQDPVTLITGQRGIRRQDAVAVPSEIERLLRDDYLVGAEPAAHGRTGHGKTELTEGQKAEAFWRERWPAGRGMRIYGLMKTLLSPKSRGSASDVPDEDPWRDLLDAAPSAPQLRAQIDREIRPLYERSDALAVYYADTYRSTYIITYFAAFLAVALALAGLAIPHGYSIDTQVNLKAVLVALELLIVGLIVGLVIVGTRNRWHQKWMDYRAMAEMLRHLRFLAYMGAHRRRNAPVRQDSARGGAWTSLLVDRAASRIGLPDVTIDAAYIGALALAVKDKEVEAQLRYHTKNARTLHRLNHILHGAGDWCFYLTAALLAGFLIIYGIDRIGLITMAAHAAETADHHAPSGLLGLLYASKAAVGVLAAALPALGAALSGIRFTGEFETLGSRSEAMAYALFDLRKRYGELCKAPDFDHANLAVRETAAVLSADIDDWKTLYTHRRLSLPA